MKKVLKIFLRVFLALLAMVIAVVTVFVCMNWELVKSAANMNNFKAAWILLTSNSEDIDKQITDNEGKYDEAVQGILGELDESGSGSGMTQEALDALNSGEYTEEEMTRIISSGGAELEAINKEREERAKAEAEATANADANANAETESHESTSPDTEKDIQPSASGSSTAQTTPGAHDAAVSQAGSAETDNASTSTKAPDTTSAPQPSENVQQSTETATPPPASQTAPTASTAPTAEDTAASIAKLYVVKSRFVNELASLEKTITNAYLALPKDQQVPASRKSVAKQYISIVSNLELECDAEVDAILAELKTKLESQGKSTAVVDSIRTAYEEEKSLKKAYYLDIYMNGLPPKKKSSDTQSKENTQTAASGSADTSSETSSAASVNTAEQ